MQRTLSKQAHSDNLSTYCTKINEVAVGKNRNEIIESKGVKIGLSENHALIHRIWW